MGIRRIGLLGGSFNPAHDGHRYISLLALKRLALDEVWWLVTPQNPLKSAADTAPLGERMAAAMRVARHPRIRISDLETRLRTSHTADTLARLRPRFRRCRFVWLMGADNLVQISRWKDWQKIFHLAPIAVFSRPPYSRRALTGQSARVFARHRLPAGRARSLADREPPAWVFLHARAHSGSATRIRAGRAKSTSTAGTAPLAVADVHPRRF